MGFQAFRFRWPVNEAGYEWTDGIRFDQQSKFRLEEAAPNRFRLKDDRGKDVAPPRATLILRSKSGPGGGSREPTYEPLRDSGLFRSFADTEPTLSGILTFADRFGMLGLHDNCLMAAETQGTYRLAAGEWLMNWQMYIQNMHRTVQIWDLIGAKDETALRGHLRWQEASGNVLGGWVFYPDPALPDLGQPLYAFTAKGHQFLGHSPPEAARDDIRFVATTILIEKLNWAMTNSITPRLAYDEEENRPRLHFAPKSLLGALCLQFAQAIDGNREFRSCKECGKWFVISLEDDGRTARRLFCSDRCKVKEYRTRKDRAISLRAAGKTPHAIAGELDTDIDTIKKWVAKRRNRK